MRTFTCTTVCSESVCGHVCVCCTSSTGDIDRVYPCVCVQSMAGFDVAPKGAAGSTSMTSNDAYHDVSDVRPFHLPHIFNNCTTGETTCVLNATTVDMPVFDTLENADTGFVAISAVEMRVKMKSREAFWQAAGIPNVNSTVTDLTGSRCREYMPCLFRAPTPFLCIVVCSA